MDRKQKILSAIINHFIQTAEPVGSKTILVSYDFKVSPATIRSEMATLEKEGLIYQPHTSAGRIPTSLGYRKFVEELADFEKAKKTAQTEIAKVFEQYKVEKAREKIYDAVSILARTSQNVSFATLPDNKRTFYLGLSNVLKQPEFSHNPIQASQVIEVLENNDNFVSILGQLDIIEDKANIFIGEENIIENIKSCSLVVTKYKLEGFNGYMGILGPIRMDYPFGAALVEEIIGLIKETD
ncbi:hypothetical protein KKG71_03855 [Patescibacteria group bacterium]|nr:hypothetical protein [Patescibacteria group bacterium]